MKNVIITGADGFVGSYTLITPAGKELFRSLREKILEVE